MKKSYLMIAAAAALFAACSNTDTFKEINNQDVAIGFNSTYMYKQTKAEITDAWLTDASLTPNFGFGVFGYKYAETSAETATLFNNEEVSYQNSDWHHSTVRYWDKSVDDGYFFYAYAPYSADNAHFYRTAQGNSTTTGFTYDLGTQVFADASAAATIDLCVARVEATDYKECYYPGETVATPGTSNSTNPDGHVSFSFNHVLSKLSFNVKSEGFESTYEVTLRSLKVAFPEADKAVWTQTAKTADAGKITYTNWANKTISLTDATQLANINTLVFEDNDNDNTNDIIVETTKKDITGAKKYIVTPNEIAANAADQTKHKIYMEVKYDINYKDDATNPTIDSQTAYGIAEIQFEQNNHYILIVNIKPAKIEFDVDKVNGFTPADPALNPFDVQ